MNAVKKFNKNPNLDKRQKLIIQFIEYMIGGGVFFWSGYATFALAYSVFGWYWLLAKMLGDAVGWSLNYIVQRYWAFADPRLDDHRARRRYLLLSVVNFMIDYALLTWLKSVGVSPYIGFFVSAGLFTVWNYLWYKLWVFKTDD